MMAGYPNLLRRILSAGLMCLLAGCAGTRVQNEYVEVPNPALTMSPNAPATIWVPKKSTDSGLPRGAEVVKRGYEAMTEGSVTATQAGLAAPGGKAAAVIPRFGLVVALEGDKVFFNLGRDAGITPFQKLKVYRGGTVIEGLGLAPGELLATIEVQGFVGTGGAYGLIRQGGQLRINDLVGVE